MITCTLNNNKSKHVQYFQIQYFNGRKLTVRCYVCCWRLFISSCPAGKTTTA